MWNLYGIEPESINYVTMKATDRYYVLRPEIIESDYYLLRKTGNPEYREMGRVFFENLRRYCRTDVAYAALKDVVTKEKTDQMESFFFAETLKYLYLIFAPPSALDFDSIIFNTEAHPVKRAG
jgi:Glycosyl hydrolase family 47